MKLDVVVRGACDVIASSRETIAYLQVERLWVGSAGIGVMIWLHSLSALGVQYLSAISTWDFTVMNMTMIVGTNAMFVNHLHVPIV
jgi:hypothetical protein